jgi:hypothetical protein
MKNAVFWDVAPCRSCVNRHFGGTYRLHLQVTKIRERGSSVSRWLQTELPVDNNQLHRATPQKTTPEMKYKFLGRTNHILPFHTTRTAYKAKVIEGIHRHTESNAIS